MKYLEVIQKLLPVSPRFGDNEILAASIIKQELTCLKVNFTQQPFKTFIPEIIKAELFADSRPVPCLGSSLVSGKIPDAKYLISHFGYNGNEDSPYNIAYSPVTDDISVVDHFSVPSVTISRNDVVNIVMADKVSGSVEVNKKEINSENILVGNNTDPQNIIIAHFDSIIGPGALDNAAAVALLIGMSTDNLLQKNLFVFSGNEEISYDEYSHKSGYGFRVFESEYEYLLKIAKKVFVIDGIGLSEPSLTQNGLDWVLQVRCLDDIRPKVYWVQNDQSKVLRFFHTKSDTIDNLKEDHIESTKNLLLSQLI